MTRPELPARLLADLRALLGAEGAIADPARLVAYESDALTTLRGDALAAVFPRSREQLAAAVRLLAASGVPFVPRGAGTGLAGGAVADGAVLVCTSRMDRILALDPAEGTAEAEPGVVTARLDAAAAAHGLRYLPDPSSATACTIGGNVATNAGGPHCLRHGVTGDHVLGLEVVLPDGETVRLGRGEDGGLDLAGLFIGSEGTLGIVAGVSVRLVPRPAGARAALALFDGLEEAGAAVSAILAAGVVPVALELIDGATIDIVESSPFAAGLPPAAAALVVECEGEPEAVEEEMAVVREALTRHGAREVRQARDEAERMAIWRARKGAYGALGRAAPDVFVQDACVPRTALPELLPAIARVAERHGLRLASFFHAGDGNLHPNLLFDRRREAEVRRVEAAGAEIMRLCVEAGGTVTGEHGIGLDKRAHLPLIFSAAERAAMGRLREALDPDGRCNPGKAPG